ncbi:MAG TPA: MBL fold metallo-hydrolase [Dehalococcoidia bacterium]|nr:MBL fold metallo-hydrolase [Dehalococcoidia bacterium]
MANRFKVGDIDVLVVSDGTVTFPAPAYFAGTTAEQWAVHDRWLGHDGTLTFPYTCFVVESGGRRVLIDTGVGDVEIGPFKGGTLLADLAENGVHPEDIDAVFLTHSHLDHVGTAALCGSGAATPSFPRATYHLTSTEMEHWSKQAVHEIARHDVREAIASRFEAKDGGASIADGVTVVALPGHTPGHAGVVLSSGDQRAFILGDAISCPAQLTEPEWSGAGDLDPKLARRTQEALLREIDGTSALIGAAHFPGLTFGRVMNGEGRRYWSPV